MGMPGMGRSADVDAVEVFAPARLHLGFLDLAGTLGRRFGGLGLAIDGFGTRFTMCRADAPTASGPGAARALEHLSRVAAALGLAADVRITILETTPEHAGLGSGTQLGLAVAAALAHLGGACIGTPDLAVALGRGARSGIGIGVFDHGGFLVDGGRGAQGGPAPIVARLPFPSTWRLLLVLDPARQGLHGSAERTAFSRLPPFPDTLASTLCHLVLLQLLPALAEHDFGAVSEALGAVQAKLGDHFSTAQQGRYGSPAVAAALGWLGDQGIVGVGQSSWGPTGFALIDSTERATALAVALDRRFGSLLGSRIVSGINHGATINGTPLPGEGEP
jgi:beta-ribofuranosylaminobenzene 5'-phosphate synthase